MLERAEVKVRRADLDNTDDQRAIIELLAAYAQEPHIGGESFSPEVQARLIPELKKQSSGRHFLALDQDEPVGLAICFLGFSTFYARPLLNIHDLAVRDGHRGKGIGRQLLDKIESAAAELECCKITLEVSADNPGARKLYEDVGFRAGETSATAVSFLTKRL